MIESFRYSKEPGPDHGLTFTIKGLDVLNLCKLEYAGESTRHVYPDQKNTKGESVPHQDIDHGFYFQNGGYLSGTFKLWEKGQLGSYNMVEVAFMGQDEPTLKLFFPKNITKKLLAQLSKDHGWEIAPGTSCFYDEAPAPEKYMI